MQALIWSPGGGSQSKVSSKLAKLCYNSFQRTIIIWNEKHWIYVLIFSSNAGENKITLIGDFFFPLLCCLPKQTLYNLNGLSLGNDNFHCWKKADLYFGAISFPIENKKWFPRTLQILECCFSADQLREERKGKFSHLTICLVYITSFAVFTGLFTQHHFLFPIHSLFWS